MTNIKEMVEINIDQKVEEILSELTEIMEPIKKIKLVTDVYEKAVLRNNLLVICEMEDEDLTYKDIEIEIKETLKWEVSEEFVEEFLKEEMKMPVVTEETIKEFANKVTVYFYDVNKQKIDSEKSEKYPCIFAPEFTTTSLLRISEDSCCEEMEKLELKKLFGSQQEYLMEMKKVVESKLISVLKEELAFMQREINKYVKKMDWVFEFNEEHLKIARSK